MESQISAFTIGEAFPSYGICVGRTERLLAKLTPELFDWRPPTPDGSWHFSIGESVAHIADVAHLFYGHLRGYWNFEKMFLAPPANFVGQQGEWKRTRDFSFDAALAHLSDARNSWNEVMAMPAEAANETSDAAVAHFEEASQAVSSGNLPPYFTAGGPPSPRKMIPWLVEHETGHRCSIVTLLRTFHGVSFKDGWY